MVSAVSAIAVVAGGAANGWAFAHYNALPPGPDGKGNKIFGMNPGPAIGLAGLAAGAVAMFAGSKTLGVVLLAAGTGALAVEGARLAYDKTQAAAAAAPAGTQGVLGYQSPHQLPAFAPSNANASRGGVTQWELDSVFGQLENIRRQRQSAA